ncbi:hypothetical protein NDI40_15940 [Microcoleus vaginatus ZQ-A3]|uniref:hypothetical protein n=1 Tax=Microcoleus vaginatus TaxID=119532 RepID=UPI00168474A2|nr:hypothetical protein [Microcoleus sp. FACHB-84]
MNISLLHKWVEIRKSLDIIPNQVIYGEFPYITRLQGDMQKLSVEFSFYAADSSVGRDQEPICWSS